MATARSVTSAMPLLSRTGTDHGDLACSQAVWHLVEHCDLGLLAREQRS